MFSTQSKINFKFSIKFILSSANAFNLDSPKVLSFGKELKLWVFSFKSIWPWTLVFGIYLDCWPLLLSTQVSYIGSSCSSCFVIGRNCSILFSCTMFSIAFFCYFCKELIGWVLWKTLSRNKNKVRIWSHKVRNMNKVGMVYVRTCLMDCGKWKQFLMPY